MIIDISSLKEGEVLNIENPNFKGMVKLFDNVYTLEGTASLEVNLECDRCLSQLLLPMSFDLHDKFSKEILEDDVDAEIFKISKHIDLNERINLGLLSNMPAKVLCHENCAGLCPKCGQNFNYNTCECDNTNYDERFDVLRSIFNENREVQ